MIARQIDRTIREIRGTVSLVQEDRFRLETKAGQSLLLILGKRAGVAPRDLGRVAGTGQTVGVRFRGEPDAGAVALRVRLSVDGR